MADDQIEKARQIAQEHGARIAKASGLAEELQAIRAQISKPGARKAIVTASSPQAQKAFELMEARAEPVWPGPSRVVLPETSRVDFSEMDRLVKEAQEGMQTIRAEKRDREQRMIQTLEGVRAELIISGEREAQALERAEAAEGYNAFMRKVTLAGLAVAVLAIVVGAFVSLYVG